MSGVLRLMEHVRAKSAIPNATRVLCVTGHRHIPNAKPAELSLGRSSSQSNSVHLSNCRSRRVRPPFDQQGILCYLWRVHAVLVLFPLPHCGFGQHRSRQHLLGCRKRAVGSRKNLVWRCYLPNNGDFHVLYLQLYFCPRSYAASLDSTGWSDCFCCCHGDEHLPALKP